MSAGPQPERPRVTITDPQVMRALAHPARLAILEHLSSSEGSSTATELAAVVGLSPSATSYHLRALAKWEMVEEAPGRGDARERRWRSRQIGFSIEAGRTAVPEVRAAEEALMDAFLLRQNNVVRGWLRRAGAEPERWYDAARMSESVLLVTAEELRELADAVSGLVEPYRRLKRAGAAPEGARSVTVQLRIVPID